MATSNFAPVKFDLPLIVGGIDEEDENILDMEYEDTQAMLDQFNATLDHFEVVLEGGYYYGYQFNVKELKDYWDFENIDELTDDDADYFWGDTAENIIKEFKYEFGRIKEYFDLLPTWGFTKLGVVGTFSNGETVYRKVA